jgi:hypothetical protein
VKRRASEPHRRHIPRQPSPAKAAARLSRAVLPVRARRRRLPVLFACGSFLPALQSLRRPSMRAACPPRLRAPPAGRCPACGTLAASRDRQFRAKALPLSALGGLPRRPATSAVLPCGTGRTPVLPPNVGRRYSRRCA